MNKLNLQKHIFFLFQSEDEGSDHVSLSDIGVKVGVREMKGQVTHMENIYSQRNSLIKILFQSHCKHYTNYYVIKNS